jgi:hypothetical protein
MDMGAIGLRWICGSSAASEFAFVLLVSDTPSVEARFARILSYVYHGTRVRTCVQYHGTYVRTTLSQNDLKYKHSGATGKPYVRTAPNIIVRPIGTPRTYVLRTYQMVWPYFHVMSQLSDWAHIHVHGEPRVLGGYTAAS